MTSVESPAVVSVLFWNWAHVCRRATGLTLACHKRDRDLSRLVREALFKQFANEIRHVMEGLETVLTEAV